MLEGGEKRGRGRPPKRPAEATALDLKAVKPPFLPPDYDTNDRSTRHFGLRTAPTFRPTAEEWLDPMLYIEKIRMVGERTGIVKIIPPETWKPEFAMDTKKFRFSTRIQRLNSMEGSTRTVVNYLDQLEQFHQQQGSSFTRVPMLDRRPLDLHQLKKEVESRGGYEVVSTVTNGKRWSEIGRALGADKQCTSGSYICRNAYMRWILPFEEYLRSDGKPNVVEPAPFFDQNVEEEQQAKQSSSSSSGMKGRMGGAPMAKDSGNGNKDDPMDVDKEVKKRKPIKRKASLDRSSESSDEFDGCEICGSMRDEDRILLCDNCDNGYHLDCLNPPLTSVPQADEWFCPDCLRAYGTDFGFEDGGDYTLAEFHKYAQDFKKKWFSDKAPLVNDSPVVTEDDVEKEFWRLVESPYDEIEVEYGADLHSTQHGSGFPVAEKEPLNPYSFCGWNLNNMPVLPESLFCHIRNDISGIMIPWLYVGMVFSTFCWHTEDHYTYSVNYMHWGETKTWYGIPASHADRFEQTMRRTVPELFQTTPDLLFHLTTMLSPGVLSNDLVDVFALDQRAGEFVVTFPRAYHAGFNQGFNFAEAVNFALPNWLPFGLNCVSRYRQFHKQPVFSHDELIIATFKKDSSITTAVWLHEELKSLYEREIELRYLARAMPNIVDEKSIGESVREFDDILCSVCKTFCYLSFVTCKCNTKRAACLFHCEQKICDCETSSLTLWQRFSEAELGVMLYHCQKTANRPLEWKERYYTLMNSYRRPPLREMQKLYSLSERIPCFMEEVATLKGFIDRASEWVIRAQGFLAKVTPKRQRNAEKPPEDDSEWGIDETVTLECLNELLMEAHALPFDCLEIEVLEQLVSFWCDKRNIAISLLQSTSYPPDIGPIVDLLKSFFTFQAQGDSKNCKLPLIKEVALLVNVLNDFEWINTAQGLLTYLRDGTSESQLTNDIDTLDSVLRDSRRRYTFPAAEEYPLSALLRKEKAHFVTELKKVREMGDRWRLELIALYKLKSVVFDELQNFYKAARCLFVDKEMFAKVEGHAKAGWAWMDAYSSLITYVHGKDRKADKPTFTTAKASLEDFGSRFDIMVWSKDKELIGKAIGKVEDWVAKGKKLFGSHLGRGSQNFLSIVQDYIAQVEVCLSPEKAENYCICRSASEDGLMIECDSCKVWYHTQCLRVTKKEAKSQTNYVCLVCDPAYASNASSSSKKTLLKQITSFLEEASELPLVPEEAESIKSLVTLLKGWLESVKGLLSKDQEGVAELRNHLRALEGYPVSLEDGINEKIRDILFKGIPRVQEPKTSDSEDEDAHDGRYHAASRPPVRGNEPTETETFCVCKRKYVPSEPMIACDTCEDWFHFDCVGLTVSEAEAIVSYQCPQCRPTDSKKITLKLPKLPDATDALPQQKRKDLTDSKASSTKRYRRSSIEPAAAPAAAGSIAETTNSNAALNPVPTQAPPPPPPAMFAQVPPFPMTFLNVGGTVDAGLKNGFWFVMGASGDPIPVPVGAVSDGNDGNTTTNGNENGNGVANLSEPSTQPSSQHV
ncbi:hypothetical protein HDU97_006119 [Phlyctochytrium planicorne]|nr:hypothetical protein HDU97_006119 [Phlyctochytrium planicorne]